MKRRKHVARSSPGSTDSQAGAGREGLVRHYARLAVACVGAAVVIAAVMAFFGPASPPPLEPIASEGVPELPSAEPTVVLPAEVEEVPTEVLRQELQQVGADLLARYPKVSEALHVVALLYSELQRTTEAEKIWRECIELDPKHLGPYIGLATAAMELGQDESAVETLHQALAAGCSSPEAYHQLAAALTKLGRLEEAVEVIQQGLVAFPHAADNWFQLGQTQLQLERFAEAETSLRKAIDEGYQAGNVYFSLATACARQGKQEEAAKYRQEFSQRRTEQSAAANERFQTRYDTELRRIAVATLCRAGTVYDRQGDPARAELLLLRAFALDPRDLTVGGELVAIYRRAQRIADARVVQRHLTEVDPQNVFQFVNLASLSSQLGDSRLAETALKQVIGLRPDLSLGYLGLAQLYLQTGQPDQARWFAEAALRLKAILLEESARAYVVLAEACRRQGDTAAADAALTMAERLAPPPEK